MKSMIFAFTITLLILGMAANAGAENIALAVKNKNSLSETHEKPIRTSLILAGHNVTLIDNSSSNVNYNSFDLLIVAGRPGDVTFTDHLGSFAANLPVNSMPTIAIDSRYPDDWGWLSGGVSTTTSTQKQTMFISNTTHPITIGYSGTVTVHSVAAKTIVDINTANTPLQPVAKLNSVSNFGVIMAAEAGTLLPNGNVTAAKIAFFGITYPLYWTNEADALFDRTVQWALGKTDIDSDGVIDSLDNCPTVSNAGQEDSDSDGKGNVCDACPADPQNDADSDGFCSNADNCPANANPDQADIDGDGTGNICDLSDDRTSLAVSGIQGPSSNPYLCADVEVKLNVTNAGANSTAYNIGLRIDGMLASFMGFQQALALNETRSHILAAGSPFTCGNRTKSFTVFANSSATDTSPADNELSFIVNFIGQVLADADGDGTQESAIDTNNIEGDGFENYSDPNGNTQVTQLDGDSDGKKDYLIDTGKDGSFEKYWDPDTGFVVNVYTAGAAVLIDTNNDGTPDKKFENNALSAIAVIKKQINNEGGNETVFDLNNNGVAESSDRIWDSGLFTLPDLIIDSISADPSTPTPNATFKVKAAVRNLGSFNATSFAVSASIGSETKSATISVAGSGTSTAEMEFSRPEGTYNVNGMADAGGVIFEQNETNNAKSGSFTVKQPEPQPQSSSGGGGGGSSGGSSGGGFAGTRKAELRNLPASTDIEPGSGRTLRLTAANTGSISLFNVKLGLSGDGAAWASVSPAEYVKVFDGQSVEFTLQIKIPDGSPIGEKMLTIELIGTGIKLDSDALKINVKKAQPETRPKFVLKSFHVPEEVSAGDNAVITVILANEGDEDGEITFSLEAANLTFIPDSQRLAIAADETGSAEFTAEIPADSAGTIEVELTLAHSGSSKTVTKNMTVKPAAKPDVQGQDLLGFITKSVSDNSLLLIGIAAATGAVFVVSRFLVERPQKPKRAPWTPPSIRTYRPRDNFYRRQKNGFRYKFKK